jgi:hypothetical protein
MGQRVDAGAQQARGVLQREGMGGDTGLCASSMLAAYYKAIAVTPSTIPW